MYWNGGVSSHCLVDHTTEEAEEFGRSIPIPKRLKPVFMLRHWYLNLDRKMHFSGVRGTLWRAMGVVRSSKNPNICNM